MEILRIFKEEEMVPDSVCQEIDKDVTGMKEDEEVWVPVYFLLKTLINS